jgi:hypothetical protein
LIIHSCATIVPRGVCVVKKVGRWSAWTIARESIQSTMKFGSRSNSCMNISQNPDMIRMKTISRRLKRFEKVIQAVFSTPPDWSPPASTLAAADLQGYFLHADRVRLPKLDARAVPVAGGARLTVEAPLPAQRQSLIERLFPRS